MREAVYLSDRIYLLFERPAQILREVSVLLLRPRTLADLGTREASAIEAEFLDGAEQIGPLGALVVRYGPGAPPGHE